MFGWPKRDGIDDANEKPGNWPRADEATGERLVSFATLEGAPDDQEFPETPDFASSLILWHRQVWRKPLRLFTIFDLTRACRQGMHIEQVVPRILRALQIDCMAGEYRSGEMLESLENVPESHWRTHHNQAEALLEILPQVLQHEEMQEDHADVGEMQDYVERLRRRLLIVLGREPSQAPCFADFAATFSQEQRQRWRFEPWHIDFYETPFDLLDRGTLWWALRAGCCREQLAPYVVASLQARPISDVLYDSFLLNGLAWIPEEYWRSHPQRGASMMVLCERQRKLANWHGRRRLSKLRRFIRDASAPPQGWRRLVPGWLRRH